MYHPDPENIKLAAAMARCYARFTGELLCGARPEAADEDIAEALYAGSSALLCHDGAADPRFIYANQASQRLWSLSWDEFIGMPSRMSAEPDARDARAAMLAEAAENGFVTGYEGVRIASDGRRFLISGATIFTVTNGTAYLGQAAVIPTWTALP